MNPTYLVVATVRQTKQELVHCCSDKKDVALELAASFQARKSAYDYSVVLGTCTYQDAVWLLAPGGTVITK